MKHRSSDISEPLLMFVPGRYYLGLCFVDIPKSLTHPNGGDVTAKFWRLDHEPEVWRVNYRFRYYFTPGDPFGGMDKRSELKGMMFPGSEADAERGMDKFCLAVGVACGISFSSTPEVVDKFLIKGDCEVAVKKIVENPPPWMHIKKVSR